MIMNTELAINGGTPAKQRPDPPMFPGGMMIGEEEEQAALKTLRRKRLFRFQGPTPGPSAVEEFERAFAAMAGTRYALAVASGTSALFCGLQGIGVGPGDEVIIPAFTWVSCPAAIMAAGAVPILAEVDESLTLDLLDVERKITPYTKAIMPVHMRGVPCRMDELLALAQRRGLKVIEDGAQAVGGSYHGRRLGSMGDVGCFSLQFHKIITAGEGGMVVTNDTSVWQRGAMCHEVDAANRYGVAPAEALLGLNLRMPELIAAVLLVQLRRLEGLLAGMRRRKQAIIDGIAETCRRTGVVLQDVPDPAGDASVCLFLFLPSAGKALQVAEALRAENIGSHIYYRPGVADMHCYASWSALLNKNTWTPQGGPWRWAQRPIEYSAGMCPRTLDLLGRGVSLNINPLFTDQDIAETNVGVNKVLSALA